MNKPLVDQTIEDLVTRSRLGDQVATATLVIVGKQADSGKKRAIEIRNKVLDYSKKNPQQFQKGIVFGIETPEKQEIIGDACILKRNLYTGRYTGAGLALLLLTLGEYSIGILAHGPSLLMDSGEPNEIVSSVREALQSEELLSIFDFGNENTNKPTVIDSAAKTLNDEQLRALSLGSIIGRARRLQAVMNPNVPIAILCLDTAWELE
jgi:hypothetical protein